MRPFVRLSRGLLNACANVRATGHPLPYDGREFEWHPGCWGPGHMSSLDARNEVRNMTRWMLGGGVFALASIGCGSAAPPATVSPVSTSEAAPSESPRAGAMAKTSCEMGRIAACERACEANDSASCLAFGLALAQGTNGIAKNEPRAATFFERGCQGGQPSACFNFGLLVAGVHGNAVPDYPKAAGLYQKACDGGVASGCFNLAQMYAYGEKGLPKNEAKAAPLFTRGCDKGDASSCRGLGLLKLGKDDKAAVALFKKACADNDAQACFQLGVATRKGIGGIPKSDTNAAAHYKKSCDKDFGPGCHVLGLMTKVGMGVPKDPALAKVLFKKGCSLKSEASCEDARKP